MRLSYQVLLLGSLQGFFFFFLQKETFLKGAITNFDQVGALAPFSQKTGRSMIRESLKLISQAQHKELRLLEIGAGTGAVTEMIIADLEKRKVNYSLDLIEIDSDFAALLSKKFENNKRVKVYCKDVYKFKSLSRYHFALSTLPLNGKMFTGDMIKQLFSKIDSMLIKNGVFTFVGYVGAEYYARPYYKITTPQDTYEHLVKKYKVIDQLLKKYVVKKKLILQNFPPTWIYICSFGEKHLKKE